MTGEIDYGRGMSSVLDRLETGNGRVHEPTWVAHIATRRAERPFCSPCERASAEPPHPEGFLADWVC